jgi:hypothetical protein
MVHTATMAEKRIRIAAADFVSRKLSASTGAPLPPPPKRQFGSSSAGSQGRMSTYSSQDSGSRPRCNTCGKMHSGECKVGSNACYRCGKSGHFARECTQVDAYRGQGSHASINQPKPVASARVYSLTPDSMHAGENTTDVVTGTIPLFGSIACVLFDSGATHSFISSSYVKLCRLTTEPLEFNMCVTTPVGDTITCRKCMNNSPIVIEGRLLPAKLAVFGMLGFNIILGMDWLARYDASITCRRKEVTFRPHGIDEFTFYGSNVRSTPLLLSAVQAIKNVRDGA